MNPEQWTFELPDGSTILVDRYHNTEGETTMVRLSVRERPEAAWGPSVKGTKQ